MGRGGSFRPREAFNARLDLLVENGQMDYAELPISKSQSRGGLKNYCATSPGTKILHSSIICCIKFVAD